LHFGEPDELDTNSSRVNDPVIVATFDPVASPAQMVAASTASSSQALESFTTNSAALADLLSSFDEADWAALAEAPPGHVSIGAMAHHALWDSWVHERDVLIPLGIEPTVEVDEVTACLRYAASLSPAFAVTQGGQGHGILQIAATRPRVSVRVEVGSEVHITDAEAGTDTTDVTLEGAAVDLVEALSMRGSLGADVTPGFEWMLQGLATIFDQSPG